MAVGPDTAKATGKADENQRGYVRVRGARHNNLRNVDIDIPRDSFVAFTGLSGSGKSSLAFGTLYAEAQRRYLESVAPYARRLIEQAGVPEVDRIDGLPPAVALQQQRGPPTARSSVGSVTTLSSLVRMLYSRAGTYPSGQTMLYAEDFSANTVQGACPTCHGLGRVYDATEQTMVPDPSLTIRQRAIAAWPTAWHGQNLRDILVTLGYDVDTPWKDLPRKDRDWILFTQDTPTVPVYAGLTPHQTKVALKRKEEPSYQGTFTGARRYVLDTFATSKSELMKKRVSQYLIGRDCAVCHGKRLKPESLSVKFAGMDITALGERSLVHLRELFTQISGDTNSSETLDLTPEKRLAAQRIAEELVERLSPMIDLGLGYLSLGRATPTLSSGEMQRIRLATQLSSQLFGVVYVLDEPSAGLHPADGDALLSILQRLISSGNSLFVVEHDLDLIRRADWVVDVGPGAGVHGGNIVYSGPLAGLANAGDSLTRQYLFDHPKPAEVHSRTPEKWLKLRDVTRNNLSGLNVELPLGCFTSVTGVSGSGKSSLVSLALPELVNGQLGRGPDTEEESDPLLDAPAAAAEGAVTGGMETIKRVIQVNQKAIGRTPRSNLATYTGLFDHVRKLFANTPLARSRKYNQGRFSFNLVPGRCATCEGEGSVKVELLFLPSVYAPCSACEGRRYNPQTLEVLWMNHTIADILQKTVEEACTLFTDEPSISRPLELLREIGLGYLRLGQPATELSGGEAQRVKLATELQRTQRGDTLYILDEPTAGLHPADADRLMRHLQDLVDAGNTVVVVEHDMRLVAQTDWVIDMGPGAGADGGLVVAAGTPVDVSNISESITAPYLRLAINKGQIGASGEAHGRKRNDTESNGTAKGLPKEQARPTKKIKRET